MAEIYQVLWSLAVHADILRSLHKKTFRSLGLLEPIFCRPCVLFASQPKCSAYLKPVDRTAVDERRELAQSVAERVADWTHCQHDVKLVTAALDKHVEQRHRRTVCLL